jgi:hypothetical protein
MDLKLCDRIRRKFQQLSPTMTERQRRLWAGTEADSLGYGGVATVAQATSMAISTVRKGRDEIRAGVSKQDIHRDRRPGAGRKPSEQKQPRLVAALEALVDPVTRGDPESPLRWTAKSTHSLKTELRHQGFTVGSTKVGQLLKRSGYTLQGNSRMKEGAEHPDRNAQFEYISAQAADFLARGLPVLSVDTKKKESIGEFANHGREWQPKGKPVEVLTYDFTDEDSPKAIPYGVYDVGDNRAFVNVGTDHDTPVFAVHSIERWWQLMGSPRYPNARELYVTADAGGSNSRLSHGWKAQLQDLADRYQLTIHVSHYPPGTSKWNKIEHRLFSFISLNWRGRPLTCYRTVVSLIAATRTTKGLVVSAELDEAKYPIGIKVKKQVMRSLCLEPAAFRGEWNYTLRPRTKERIAQALKLAEAEREPVPHTETRSKWRTLIQEHQQSGLSAQHFCRDRGIPYTSFVTARSRLKLRPPHWTEKWKPLVLAQRVSGLSPKQFCRKNRLPESTFRRALKILRRGPADG